MNSKGYGLKVSAKYYMHIFDRTKGHSKQRVVQTMVSQPIQYFISYDFSASGEPAKTQFDSEIDDQFIQFKEGVF